MNILVAGWFSFEQMGASAGDLLATDLVCNWLSEAGYTYDIAKAAPFEGGVPWQETEPSTYAAVIFVCGPFGNGPPLTEFLQHFCGLPLVGINLTMLDNLEQWNPFDLLLERDSNRTVTPDVVFLTEQPRVPVVGLILVHHQKEYGDRAMHASVDRALQKLMGSRELAVIPIDTRLDDNDSGLQTSAEVESVIARMDMVVTTRLHGMVLALKNDVPALVVDPIAGGAKIARQATAIKWETVFIADNLDEDALNAGLDFCLSNEGKERAVATSQFAIQQLLDRKNQFLQGLFTVLSEKR